eukprot:403357964
MMHEVPDCVAQIIDTNKKLFFMYFVYENLFVVGSIETCRTRWFRLSVTNYIFAKVRKLASI